MRINESNPSVVPSAGIGSLEGDRPVQRVNEPETEGVSSVEPTVNYYVPDEPVAAEPVEVPVITNPYLVTREGIPQNAVQLTPFGDAVTPAEEPLNPEDALNYSSYRLKALQVQAASIGLNAINVANLSTKLVIGGLLIPVGSALVGVTCTVDSGVSGGIEGLLSGEAYNVNLGIPGPTGLVGGILVGATVGAYRGFVEYPLKELKPGFVHSVQKSVFKIRKVHDNTCAELAKLDARYKLGQELNRNMG